MRYKFFKDYNDDDKILIIIIVMCIYNDQNSNKNERKKIRELKTSYLKLYIIFWRYSYQ